MNGLDKSFSCHPLSFLALFSMIFFAAGAAGAGEFKQIVVVLRYLFDLRDRLSRFLLTPANPLVEISNN
jgi:hypothetical protein